MIFSNNNIERKVFPLTYQFPILKHLLYYYQPWLPYEAIQCPVSRQVAASIPPPKYQIPNIPIASQLSRSTSLFKLVILSCRSWVELLCRMHPNQVFSVCQNKTKFPHMLYIEPHQVWFWVWSSSSNGRGSIQIGHSGRGCIKIYQNVLSPLLHQKVDNHTPLRTSNLWLSDTLSAMIDVSFGSLYCNNYHFAGGAFLTWPTLPHNAQHEDDISLNKMTPRFIRSRPLSLDHYQSKRALRTDILTILAAHQQIFF